MKRVGDSFLNAAMTCLFPSSGTLILKEGLHGIRVLSVVTSPPPAYSAYKVAELKDDVRYTYFLW